MDKPIFPAVPFVGDITKPGDVYRWAYQLLIAKDLYAVAMEEYVATLAPRFLMPRREFTFRKVFVDNALIEKVAAKLRVDKSKIRVMDAGGWVIIPEGDYIYREILAFANTILPQTYEHGNDGIDCDNIASEGLKAMVHFGDHPAYSRLWLGSMVVQLTEVTHDTSFGVFFPGPGDDIDVTCLDANPKGIFWNPPPAEIFNIDFWGPVLEATL